VDGSLEETLRPVAPYVPDTLISRACLAEIGAVARDLPGAVSSFFGFECRLGDPQPSADFLVCTRADNREHEALAGTDFPDAPPGHLLEHPTWSRLRDFAVEWAAPGSALHGRVGNIWLEFDVGREAPGLPVPSIFLGPTRSLAARPTSASGSATGDRPDRWLTEVALPLLRGSRLPPAVERRLIACIDAQPPTAGVFQVGLMLARQSDALRLCIAVDPRAVAEYLDRIGWSGPVRRVTDLVAGLAAVTDRICVDVDVDAAVGPRIGVECYFNGFDPGRGPGWQRLLDYLVEGGLCRPEKRAGLAAYPGSSDAVADPDRWPERLLRASSLLGPRAISVIFRSLHHVKVVYEPGRPLEAKAYLAAGHRWLTPYSATSRSTAIRSNRPAASPPSRPSDRSRRPG